MLIHSTCQYQCYLVHTQRTLYFTVRVTLLIFSWGLLGSYVSPPLAVGLATVGMASWNLKLIASLEIQHVTHADGTTDIVADSQYGMTGG